jgi:O-antigen/teichoic acid export membrane protein
MSESSAIVSPEAEIPEIPAESSVGARLLHGTLIYGVTNFGLKAVNFGLVVLYTRFLTPSDFGIVALAEIIAAFVGTVSSLGLTAAMQPLYFSYRGDELILRRCVSTILRFGAVATLMFFILSVLGGMLLVPMTGLRIEFFPYIALALCTTATLQLVDYRLALYQIQERPASYSVLAIACFTFTAIATIYRVIVQRGGAAGLLSGKLIGALLTSALAIWWLRQWLSGGWQRSFIREALPLALPLMPHMLLALGLVVADRLILQRYRSMQEVGVYSIAYTIGMMMFLVTSSLCQAWSPVFYRMASQGDVNRHLIGRMLASVLLLLGVIAIFGAAIAHPFARLVLDPRYQQAEKLIPLVIGGYLFHAVFALFQLSAIHARKAQFIWVVSIVSLGANLALNLAWVPKRGMYGAAWATTAAYALEGLMMYAYAQRVYPLSVSGRRLIVVIGIFCAVLSLTQLQFKTGAQTLAAQGSCAMLGLLLLWKMGKSDLIILKGLLYSSKST